MVIKNYMLLNNITSAMRVMNSCNFEGSLGTVMQSITTLYGFCFTILLLEPERFGPNIV